MKHCLISIGSFPEQALTTVCAAFACGAAKPVGHLDIFHLSSRKTDDELPLLRDLSACARMMPRGEDALPVFRTEFSFRSCTAVLPQLRDFCAGAESDLLFSALRGRNMPVSYRSDREAAEWAFSDLLENRPNDSCRELHGFVDSLAAAVAAGEPVRLAVLCDPGDSFSAAAALVLLPWLREQLPGDGLYISLIALSRTESPLPDSFFPTLRAAVQALHDRALLRAEDGDVPLGADAMWLLSLPSSAVRSPDSFRLLFLAAARVIGTFLSRESLPAPGLHTRSVSGFLSLQSLGDEAAPFSAFLLFGSWLLSDLIPALKGYVPQAAARRALPLNSRASLLRGLFSGVPEAEYTAAVSLLEKTVGAVLRETAALAEALPEVLACSPAAEELWQRAVDACGRFVTAASEYDVAAEEAEASGLGSVRPVHRESLADTDEELLARRLVQMAEQLKSEEQARNEILSAAGPLRAVQARQDCLSRCESALVSAREKFDRLSTGGADHLTIARQERRLRLLKAAIRRCRSELEAGAVLSAPAPGASGGVSGAGVFSASGLAALSRAAAENADPVSLRGLRDSLPSLLEGYALPDVKDLSRRLQARFRSESPEGGASFGWLLSRGWAVCAEAVSALRFLSRGDVPAVPLLPDLFPSRPLLTLPALLSLLPDGGDPARDEAEKRGLLAMLILRQYKRLRPGEPGLSAVSFGKTAPLLRSFLSAAGAESAVIFSLPDENGDPVPFALIVPGRAFVPARRTAAHEKLIPSFVSWFSHEEGLFRDPCVFLSEGDRSLLISRLSVLLGGAEGLDAPLARFLESFRDGLAASVPSGAGTRLKTRIRAVCGLSALPAYASSLRKTVVFYEHFNDRDDVLSALSGRDRVPADPCTDIPDEVVYSWRGIPFAREHSRRMLEDTRVPEEEFCLNTLDAECKTLSGISDDYRDALLKETSALIDRFPDALPPCAEEAAAVREEAQKPLPEGGAELRWPWDPLSPSVRTVLTECLGEALSEPALRPFSDLLAVFPARGGEIIGDSLFSGMCATPPYRASADAEAAPDGVAADAVLPPLSPGLAAAVCRLPEGRLLLSPDLIRLERPDESAFRVILTLNGAFPLRLVRDYSGGDVVFLYAQEIPTLAVWPSAPFPRDRWRAYFVYAHLREPYAVSVLGDEGSDPVPLSGDDSRYTAVLRDFPSAFLFSRDGRSLGALPNLLPEPELIPSGPVTACVDFGSVGTSVVFSSDAGCRPLQGAVMVRTVVNNPAASRDLLRHEFLPAVPVSALLPTVSRIFRNVPGAAPVPFTDGIVLMSADLQDLLSTPSDALYTCLKWEEEKGRSGLICLHQVLLMAALQARMDGAETLSWRFALPDEMARDGREKLRTLFLNTVDRVMEESGFPVSSGEPPVSFAAESAALGAYFRLCASEDTRGGFMVLDIGACTADISLFLRGREEAVRVCQIPLGVHYMLLPTLLRAPEILQDFAAVPDAVFQADLRLLSGILSDAAGNPAALRKARLSLDHFLSDYYPLLIGAMGFQYRSGTPTRLGAVLLLHLSYLIMLSGLVLLQIAVDPNRNDYLPEQMSLCLSGRGSLLMESLPEPVKTSLWHFLTMFNNRRVASLSLLFSAEKKMEIPVGLSTLRNTVYDLPSASPVPASVSVRPEELLPEFLLRFAREFPLSAGALFPGFFTNDFYHPFSAWGEAAVTAAIDQSFVSRETPRPYDSLAGWIGSLLEMAAAPRG